MAVYDILMVVYDLSAKVIIRGIGWCVKMGNGV